jgi:hypothetical protein
MRMMARMRRTMLDGIVISVYKGRHVEIVASSSFPDPS